MDLLCTNCGTEFSETGSAPRCPNCLRKNGIIPKSEGGTPTSKRRVYYTEALITVLLGVAVGIWLILSPDSGKKKPSDRPSWMLPTVEEERALLKSAGFTGEWLPLFEGGDPLSGVPEATTLPAVLKLFKGVRQAQGEGMLPPVRSLEALGGVLTAGGQMSSFERALLTKALLDRAGIESGVVSLLRVDGAEVEVHPWRGRFGLAVTDPETKEVRLLWPLRPSAVVNSSLPMDNRSILGVALSLKALALVKGHPLSLSHLYTPAPKVISAAYKAALKLAQAGVRLAPKIPLVHGAQAWVSLRLGLIKPAASAADTLLATATGRSAKAFVALFKQQHRLLKEADTLLKEAPEGYLPLRALVAAQVHGSKAVRPLLPLLLERKDRGADFVILQIVSTIMDREEGKGYLSQMEALAKRYRGQRWVEPPLLLYFIRTGAFKRASRWLNELPPGTVEQQKEREKMRAVLKTVQERQAGKGSTSPEGGIPAPKGTRAR